MSLCIKSSCSRSKVSKQVPKLYCRYKSLFSLLAVIAPSAGMSTNEKLTKKSCPCNALLKWHFEKTLLSIAFTILRSVNNVSEREMEILACWYNNEVLKQIVCN